MTITICGLAAGGLAGAVLSQMLVKVLPPPDALTVPWSARLPWWGADFDELVPPERRASSF